MNEELMVKSEELHVVDEENDEWIETPSASEEVTNLSETVLETDEIKKFQSRWNSIQIEFVDRPRASVEQADALVAEAMEKIERMLSEKRAVLAERWFNHEDASTEDLRLALHGYRSFLNRLFTL